MEVTKVNNRKTKISFSFLALTWTYSRVIWNMKGFRYHLGFPLPARGLHLGWLWSWRMYSFWLYVVETINCSSFFGSSVVCGTLNIQLIHRLISPHERQTDAHRIFHSSSSIWPLPSFCDLDYVGAITNAITIIRTGSFALPTLSLGPLFSIGEQSPVNVTVSSMATWNLCSLNLVHLKFLLNLQ